MKTFLALFAAMACAVATQAADLLKGDAVAGQQKVVVCGACHGADGNSLIPAFPKLAGLGEKYLLQQLQHIRD